MKEMVFFSDERNKGQLLKECVDCGHRDKILEMCYQNYNVREFLFFNVGLIDLHTDQCG